MDSSLAAYLPQDRRQALARGADLPERTTGAALFADISGFTPLTEALDRALGARRGAEELTRQINRVYDVLIAEVDRYGGSVISFAGDAITCWFNTVGVGGWELGAGERALIPNPQPPTSGALRAVACALAMQTAMRRFAAISLPDGAATALALQVAVASGPARRFVVGDPAIQLLDVLAGATLARMAAAEHLAAKGEVVLDARTAAALSDALQVAEWRIDHETGERFAVVSTNDQPPTTNESVTLSPDHLVTLSGYSRSPIS
jgi:class 3 adenylate cyclase